MKVEDWDKLEELGFILTKNGKYKDINRKSIIFNDLCYR
jgi:hypothetical protein